METESVITRRTSFPVRWIALPHHLQDVATTIVIRTAGKRVRPVSGIAAIVKNPRMRVTVVMRFVIHGRIVRPVLAIAAHVQLRVIVVMLHAPAMRHAAPVQMTVGDARTYAAMDIVMRKRPAIHAAVTAANASQIVPT